MLCKHTFFKVRIDFKQNIILLVSLPYIRFHFNFFICINYISRYLSTDILLI